MLEFIYIFILLLFFLSLFGYILVILKEKVYMKRNIIIIENKYLTKEDLKEIDINEFILQGKKVKSGDEIKIVTSQKEKLNGTLIGANKCNKSIHIITFKNKIKKLKIDNILKLKITSKYGKFLNY
ncbi:MAG: hypothetical protein ACTHW2_11290 [Tissierella sp.]|uniref:hypothetical protein n=1 Tax=Tissierella sp. TaxID=41274 RepID=UPI003F975960